MTEYATAKVRLGIMATAALVITSSLDLFFETIPYLWLVTAALFAIITAVGILLDLEQ